MDQVLARNDQFAGEVAARIERLPVTSWQVRARIIIGTATFFDAFDALSIAYILPAIIPMWRLLPQDVGLLISAGFFGQLFGALFFGWIAERYGRMPALMGSIALYSTLSLACAFAQDYQTLLILRIVQGFGLGGEVPVAATYINELATARKRGRFVLLFELVFPCGILAAARALDRAQSRLAIHVRGWRAAGGDGALSAKSAAGIAALAGFARTCHGSGRRAPHRREEYGKSTRP